MPKKKKREREVFESTAEALQAARSRRHTIREVVGVYPGKSRVNVVTEAGWPYTYKIRKGGDEPS